MTKRGKKTKHAKRGLAEETAPAATQGNGGTSTTSAIEPMVEDTSPHAIIRKLFKEDAETGMEGELQSSALREMITKALKIMMEPGTSSIAQERLPIDPKIVETVTAFDQQMAKAVLKKVFDMVEVMFIELITKGEVSSDFSSICLMPSSKGQREQPLPTKIEEWSLDQYKLLITRLTGHVTIVMLNPLMHNCNNDFSDDSIEVQWKAFTKSVYTLTHNLAVQAANTNDHNKFKEYMKPGLRNKPFSLPYKTPTPPSREASKEANGPQTPLSAEASKEAGPQTLMSAAASGVATDLPASRPAQTASQPQSGMARAAASVVVRPAQTLFNPQSGTAHGPASVASRSVVQRTASANPVNTTASLPKDPQRITMMVIEVLLSSIRDLTRLGLLPEKNNV